MFWEVDTHGVWYDPETRAEGVGSQAKDVTAKPKTSRLDS
jgi:hypothetical protein